MQPHVDHVGPANDLPSSTPELTDFRYGIHRNSVVVWVQFRGPFVLHRLDHGRLHVYSPYVIYLDTIITISLVIIYYY